MITSLQNEQIKRVRALHKQRSARAEAGLFVIEGPTLLQEAIQTSAVVREVYFVKRFSETSEGAALIQAMTHASVEPILVHDTVMKSMCDTVTPQGVIAVSAMPARAVPETLTFALIIDAVSDPGNLGTILRTAAGAGVDVVFLMPDTVDVFSSKVVRGAMGAHFRLPMCSLEWDQLRGAMGSLPIFLADSNRGTPCHRVDFAPACALIVSNEAHGPSSSAVRLADLRVTIPMPGMIESLNVAMSTGILLYEMLRQRLVQQETQS